MLYSLPILKKHQTEEYKNKILNELKKYAESRKYELISIQYTNSHDCLIWKDPEGIEFSQSYHSIKNRGFVSKEKYNQARGQKMSAKEHIEELSKIAEARGGKLISTEYINNEQKLKFQDKHGNIFEICASGIKRGYWSPYELYSTENIIRQIFEYIFKKPFPTKWDLITRENKKSLQLDGYAEIEINEKIYKIAFEYQGHPNHRKDIETLNRDLYKNSFCKNNNIILITIDVLQSKKRIISKIVFNIVLSYIIKSFNENNINFDFSSINDDIFNIDFSKINHYDQMYLYWKEYGEKNGYELLSTEYKGTRDNLLWKQKNTDFIFLRNTDTINLLGWPAPQSINILKKRAKRALDAANEKQYSKKA